MSQRESDEFGNVEVGDKIRFTLPHGEYEGDEVTGGVGEVNDDQLVVKAAAYYHIGRDEFVSIKEKDAF